MVNAILAKRVNHIVAKGDNPIWPKGSKSRGFSNITDGSKIYPPFLAYYVSSQLFRKAVYPLAQGSTRFNLQKSDFMKKKFPFPMIEKQRKIYSILNTYSDKLIVEKQIIGLLCSQKRYLLRQLFI